jgi:hypothetical protein
MPYPGNFSESPHIGIGANGDRSLSQKLIRVILGIVGNYDTPPQASALVVGEETRCGAALVGCPLSPPISDLR